MRFESSIIQYGMASIPVKIGNTQKSATGDLLHMCCPDCESKISQKNFCSNEECVNHEILENARNKSNRYVDVDKENRKIITQEQLKSIKEDGNMIEVIGKIGNIDELSTRINKSWYCIPDDGKTRGKKFIKPWASLRHALHSGQDGVLVRIYSRGKEKLGVMSADEKTIVIYGLSYKDETNMFDAVIPQEITENDKKMGETFVSSLKEIELDSIENEEREKLFSLLEGKLVVKQEDDSNEMDFLKVQNE